MGISTSASAVDVAGHGRVDLEKEELDTMKGEEDAIIIARGAGQRCVYGILEVSSCSSAQNPMSSSLRSFLWRERQNPGKRREGTQKRAWAGHQLDSWRKDGDPNVPRCNGMIIRKALSSSAWMSRPIIVAHSELQIA